MASPKFDALKAELIALLDKYQFTLATTIEEKPCVYDREAEFGEAIYLDLLQDQTGDNRTE